MDYSIFDYLAYYKNYTFDEVKFNEVDALLYSIIAYVPIDELRDNSSIKAFALSSFPDTASKRRRFLSFRS